MLRCVILFILCNLLFQSCRKDKNLEFQFVPGQIIVTAYPSSSFDSVFNPINQFGLKIKELDNFPYIVKCHVDSIASYRKALSGHPGVIAASFHSNDSLRVTVLFRDLNEEYVELWRSTVTKLNLSETFENAGLKSGLIIVPEGTEDDWLQKLREVKSIESASYNYLN